MAEISLRNRRKSFSTGGTVKKKKMLQEDYIKVQQKIKAFLTKNQFSN